MIGCSSHSMVVSFVSSQDLPEHPATLHEYNIVINSVTGGSTFIFFLVFSRPLASIQALIASSSEVSIFHCQD